MVNVAWPWALLLLPLPLLLSRLIPRPSRASEIAVPPLLAGALDAVHGDRSRRAGWLPVAVWLAWGLLIAAIAQPALTIGTAVSPATGRAIILAIDLSSSMERKDFRLDGEAVDRLTALKSVARAFIAARRGDRMGLVLFGDEAFSAAPISYDLASIANALEESAIGMAGRATAIGDALGLAIVKLRGDPATEKTIVLLSDGTNNSGKAEPEDAARLAKQFGIHIQSIGMASAGSDGSAAAIDPSADLDEETLRKIAEESGGQFFRARTTEELQQIYAAIDRLEASESAAPPTVPRIDIRNWLLVPLALLLGIIGLALSRSRSA